MGPRAPCPAPRALRDQLRAIREGADQSTRELIDDIIAGRTSLRDLAQTQFFLDRFVPLVSDQHGRTQLRAEVATVMEDISDPLSRVREAPESCGGSG